MILWTAALIEATTPPWLGPCPFDAHVWFWGALRTSRNMILFVITSKIIQICKSSGSGRHKARI